MCVCAGVGGPDHWAPQPQVSSSLESSTSSQEHLNFSASSSSSNKTQNQKTGPGRWKTPNTLHAVTPHSAQPPSRSDLPPPPPPPPALYPDAYDPYDPQPDLPLPPPPAAVSSVTAQQAADRKKREEQQRWYEKEKARLEEERYYRTGNVAIFRPSVSLWLNVRRVKVILVNVSGRGRRGSRRGSWGRSGPTPLCPSNPTTTEEPCLRLTTSPRWPPWLHPSPTSPLSPSLPHPDQRSWPACRGQRYRTRPAPPTLQVLHSHESIP